MTYQFRREPVKAPPPDIEATPSRSFAPFAAAQPQGPVLSQETGYKPSWTPPERTAARPGPAIDLRRPTVSIQNPASVVDENGNEVDPGLDPSDPGLDPEDPSSEWDNWAAQAEKSWDSAPTMVRVGAVAATAIGIIGTGASFYLAARVGRTSKGWLAPVGAGFLGLIGTAVASGTVAAATGAKALIPCGGSTNLAGLGALQAGVRLPRQALGRGRPCVGCGRR